MRHLTELKNGLGNLAYNKKASTIKLGAFLLKKIITYIILYSKYLKYNSYYL